MLPIAILAGGMATRLRPVSATLPKALVDVAGKPFLVRQLEYLAAQGFQRVVLCVGYRAEQIQAAIGDGARFGLDVRYAFDGDTLLGTGGALRRALPLLGEAFFVTYGDSWLPVSYAPIERAFYASGKPALMVVLENGDRWDKSNVLFRHGELTEYNKRDPSPAMRHIDYGIGVLSASVLMGHAPDQAFDLAETYHALSLAGDLAGYEVTQRFYEIGSPQSLAEAVAYFSAQRST
jgi:NDP-sugar pyrophosphorylase family protein